MASVACGLPALRHQPRPLAPRLRARPRGTPKLTRKAVTDRPHFRCFSRTQRWLPISELRKAGFFEMSVDALAALSGPLTYHSDPVLAELWDNDADAVYDDL